MSVTVDGPTVFEGNNVIQKRAMVTLNKTGVGNILNSIATYYYHQSDHSLYKIVFNNGVTAVPTVYKDLPPTAKIGDFGEFWTLNYSNGNTLRETWQVQDGGNGLAKLIIIANTNFTLSEQSTIFIDSPGNVIRMESIFWDFPSNGVTTTLTSL
jgi:hypothetical protein